MVDEPPQVPRQGTGCLGCLAYLLLTVLTWTAMGVAAWRGSLPGVIASAVLWALVIGSAQCYRGIRRAGS